LGQAGIGTSAHPHIRTSSHRHIRTSAHSHIRTFAHPHIRTSAHPFFLPLQPFKTVKTPYGKEVQRI
jgi:hypothetical protein